MPTAIGRYRNLFSIGLTCSFLHSSRPLAYPGGRDFGRLRVGRWSLRIAGPDPSKCVALPTLRWSPRRDGLSTRRADPPRCRGQSVALVGDGRRAVTGVTVHLGQQGGAGRGRQPPPQPSPPRLEDPVGYLWAIARLDRPLTGEPGSPALGEWSSQPSLPGSPRMTSWRLLTHRTR